MPLNTLIPLAVKQANITPVADVHAAIQDERLKAQEAQMRSQQLRSNELKFQDDAEQRENAKLITDAINQHLTIDADGTPTIDHVAVKQTLAQRKPQLVLDYQSRLASMSEAEQKQFDAELKRQDEQFVSVAKILQGVQDQDGWQRALPLLARRGVDMRQMPAIYDKKFVDQIIAQGTTREQHNNFMLALMKEQREAAGKGADAPKAGTFEDYVTRFAQEKGVDVASFTPKDIEAARKRYNQSDDRPQITVPVVIQTAQGPQVLDRGTGTARPIMGPDGQPVKAPDTAEMRNKTAGRELVAKSINAIESLSKKILTRVGPAQRAAAIARGAEAVFGSDPEFRVYQDSRMALAGNLAVGQQGSRPSDADIKLIWLPMVPDPYRDTAESAAMKWQLIHTMANSPAQGQEDKGGASGVKRFNPATGKLE